MTTDYNKKFIMKILEHQIRNVIEWHPPSYNPYEVAAKCFWDSLVEDDIMHMNKVKFPDIRGFGQNVPNIPSSWYVWPTLYAESILIHHLFDDDYSLENYAMIENMGIVGPYCLEDLIVEKGDVVIDGGAYIGDWSAVAAQMGGDVYAFEPSPTYSHILDKCAELNNFHVIKEGLGNLKCQKKLFMDTEPYTEHIDEVNGIPCNLTTIDDFARENNIHIDFIKADIEGYERYMLVGAKEVLQRDEPKLSLCTYHNNKEDAIILPKIIKEINPNYEIMSKNMKLYAQVK